MEACQANPLQALEVNCTAPAIMADAAKKVGALFIHFSTDYVFSGDEAGLYEDTQTNPSGLYGLSKLRGEEMVKICGESYLIIRLSSIYGRTFGGPTDPINQALDGKGLSRNNPIKVLRQLCAPTSARLVAEAVKHVIDTDQTKLFADVYHFATSEAVWKKNFSEAILQMWKYRDQGWVVEEGTLPVARPVYTVLKSKSFGEIFDFPIPNWREDFKKTMDFK